MLSPDLRVHGFTATSWLRLLSLFGVGTRAETSNASGAHGTVVVIENPDETACAAFHTHLGGFSADGYASRADLPALCERQLALRGIVVRRGAIEELTERAAARVLATEDFAAQWLALLATTRELTREGLLYFWPARTQLPLPTAAMLSRTLDVVLPDDRTFVAVLWDGDEVWTALCLRRRGREIDCLLGPEAVLEASGPLSGDYRRDHRAICRAIERELAPVHIGLFAQREQLERLLRAPHAGAWAKAVALREVIVDPAPPYVAVAVSADALRASAKKTGEWLGGIDFLSFLEPVGKVLREQIGQVASVTGLLGWNPLQVLAQRLRERDHSEPQP